MKTTDVIDYTFQSLSENTCAVGLERPISTIREQLTGLLADWEVDFSTLLNEMEEKRLHLQDIEAEAVGQSHEVEALNTRIEAQDALIETLKTKANEAITLRKEIHDKDLELKKKNSEIDSKHELIGAMQRDTEGIGRLKDAIRTKDQENARLVNESQHARQHAAKRTKKFQTLTAELEAARAELDVLKTLIDNLRGNAESESADARALATYALALEAQLGGDARRNLQT